MPYRDRFNSSGTVIGHEYVDTPPRQSSPAPQTTYQCFTEIYTSLFDIKTDLKNKFYEDNIHSVTITPFKDELLLVVLYN